jgi:hypothetical protein
MAETGGGEAVAARTRTRMVGGRPPGVAVLALIHMLAAVLGLLALAGVAALQPATGRAILLEALGNLAPLYASVSVAGILIAIGLWRLDRWAWYAAMVFTGIGLAWQLLLYHDGHQNYLYMLVYVIEAFYLNQRDVKRVFRMESERAAPVTLEHDTSGPA